MADLYLRLRDVIGALLLLEPAESFSVSTLTSEPMQLCTARCSSLVLLEPLKELQLCDESLVSPLP
jgi:hypothetical protein